MDARAFVANRPWTVTASGSPSTLTWGFADDGTMIPGDGPNDFIGFLDGVFDVSTSSSDLTQRPWFPMFQESFDRWAQVSGLIFVYEGADDGAVLKDSLGVLGSRADIRMAGTFIDGPGGATAYTWMSNTGDMVIDSGDAAYFAAAIVDDLKVRNTIGHELGHALGLMHVISADAALLLEPFNSKAFDGPQLDDIRGMQSFYGDAKEKANNGLGNGTAARATNLGSLSFGNNLAIGSDAAGDQFVLPTETDFVSITNSTDADYYSFTITTPGYLDVSLTPWGGIFSQADAAGAQAPFDANRQSDLSLAIFGPNGTTVLGSANNSGAGGLEVLSSLQLSSAGKYFARVLGVADEVQLYELQLSLSATATAIDPDFNGDGVVNGRDFLAWQRGQSSHLLSADDLAAWQANFGQLGVNFSAVPEPSGFLLLAAAIVCGASAEPARRRRRAPRSGRLRVGARTPRG
jgi:hypothetical protein